MPRNILLIEDNPDISDLVSLHLRDYGHRVEVVMDGDLGYRRAVSGDFQLIILDLMLPGMNGLEICSKLRAESSYVPILMLTAKDGVGSKVRGLDAGADDYLTKPFSFEELLARIRALLRRGGPALDPSISLADLTLDPATHEVRRFGQAINLSAKEYALLEFLMRRKNRVCTRTSIIEHVWDMHFDSDTNLVDVYIRYLRRKVDEPFDTKLIHTIRGVGYVMKEAE